NAGPNPDGYDTTDALQVWKRRRATTLEKVVDIPIQKFLSGYCVAPNSQWVVVTGKPGYNFHDCGTGRLLRTYPEIPGSCVAVSPSGRVLVSRDADDSRQGKTVFIWEQATGRPICQLECEPGQTDWSPIVVSPDGRIVASCLNREDVALWDAFTGK